MKRIITVLLLTTVSSRVFAAVDTPAAPILPTVLQHPYYVGLISGYGNTDWSQLVSQDQASSANTPLSASGSGAIIGALFGYQLLQNIAIEAQYVHYPNSQVTLLPDNGIYNGPNQFDSSTDYYALLAKVSAPFDHDRYEVFGTLGAARVVRSDVYVNIHDFRPTFGFGLSDIQWTHWNLSLAFNYTPGTGTAAYNTVSDYIPYLYAGELILTYRI